MFDIQNAPPPPLVYFGFKPGGTHPLEQDAYRRLREFMYDKGNRLSESHAKALQLVCRAYTYTALQLPGAQPRVAFPLAVGDGKTVSVAAFAAAATAAGTKVTMVVAQDRIEGLCSLKRNMLDMGVPEACIGLIHSKQYDPAKAPAARELDPETMARYASEPSINEADAHTYPILLVSHELLKVREDIANLMAVSCGRAADAGKRSLVVWDESLIKSRGHAQTLEALGTSLDHARRVLTTAEGHEDMPADINGTLDYLADAIKAMEDDFKAQRQTQTDGEQLHLPALCAAERERRQGDLAQLFKLADDRKRAPLSCETLQHLVANSAEPVRVLQGQGSGAVVTYELVISDELDRIIVLDASYNIRELEKLDSNMQVVPELDHQKSFARVTVSQLKHPGGRSTMDTKVARNAPLTRTIADRIKLRLESLAPDAGLLVFTYKARSRRNHRQVIEGQLKALGVDVEETISVNGVQRPRIAWLTWGQELGLSSFKYCKAVVLVGIYRQSREAISAAIAGQKGSLMAPEVSCKATVSTVLLSETFHHLYQAAGRGNCRTTDEAGAGEMTLDWIGEETFPAAYWRETFPQATHDRWESEHLPKPGKIAEGAGKVAEWLLEVPPGVDRVSIRECKGRAGVEDLKGRSWQLCRDQALELLDTAGETWIVDGKSFARPLALYGMDDAA